LSIDLRKCIVHWRLKEGKSLAEVSRLAGCCKRTVSNITSLYLSTGEFTHADPRTLGRPRLLSMLDKSYILSILHDNPALYLDEIQDMMWYNRDID
ncbi:hypothetical protein F5876DRAFT_3561, partial [Lentinula aff. lateritia]